MAGRIALTSERRGSEIGCIRAYGLYVYNKIRRRSSEPNLSTTRSNMSQVPTDGRKKMQSNRVELQRSIGSSSYPREQQVHTQIQIPLDCSADYFRVRDNSPFRLIVRATRPKLKGLRVVLARRTLRRWRQEAEVRIDRLVRHTLRPRPGARTNNSLRPIHRPTPQKARVQEH